MVIDRPLLLSREWIAIKQKSYFTTFPYDISSFNIMALITGGWLLVQRMDGYRIDRTFECNGSGTDSWMDGCKLIEWSGFP